MCLVERLENGSRLACLGRDAFADRLASFNIVADPASSASAATALLTAS
ncbi:hypothetical protein [Halovenus salina]|uniref:Uncharacterized protein n=1 Tax=Halovenus salina TaxID=1510225 RepID=A0ABD5W108_9EURY